MRGRSTFHLVAFELAVQIRIAIRAAGRNDLRVVPAVNVKVSATSRTGLIPDVVIVNGLADVAFPADARLPAVEVGSPGDTRGERDAKTAAYASAGVPFLWTVDSSRWSRSRVR
ncbi:Uma2 family endonuclease [Saccharothrix sp. NRRL B-16314]|uniref:Uma2 family endonuclease n=1 Tax=Saccharothrix sp. NRRL B-16314 TaxID=1463825 RepID=UPI00068B94BF|nr:Uma2 family endonuclease [Saccharothrix sp. NRRL B-16314]